MKKINKNPPPLFTNLIKKNKPNNWSDFGRIKAELRDYMLNHEQNGQCAYCESAITSDSSKSHIDHYKKKAGHLFPELECDYKNLLVSCNNGKNGGKEKHCAKSKDDRIKIKDDYNDLINPVIDNPNKHLYYSFTGDVLPKDKKAEITIEIFNLNHKSLINRRKTLSIKLDSIKTQMSLAEVKSIFKEYHSFIENIWRS